MRTSEMNRVTKETQIQLKLQIDGSGTADITTDFPFFNHMLTTLAFYSGIDIQLLAKGDTLVDDHHTIEDIGIVLGQALKEAMGDKKGITRFSQNFQVMDESLVRGVLDISNRPLLVFDGEFQREQIQNLSLENVYEFLYAFVMESRITLHMAILYGRNDHHKVEAVFKSLGRLLKEALSISSEEITSTKGVL